MHQISTATDQPLILRKKPKMQPVLLLSYLNVLVIGSFLVFQSLLLLSNLLLGSPLGFAKDAFILAFGYWLLGGSLIETYATIRLARLSKLHQYSQAEMTCLKALNLEKKSWTRTPHRYLIFSNLALMQLAQGKFQQAETSLRQSLGFITGDKRKSKHYLAAIIMNNLAIVCTRQGNLTEAESLARKALEIYQNGKDKSTSGTAFPLIVLARIAMDWNDLSGANEHLEQAQALLDQRKTPFLVLEHSAHRARIACKLELAVLRLKQGNLSEARTLCQQLLSEFEQDDQYQGIQLDRFNALIRALLEHSEQQLAEPFLEHAYALARRVPDNPDAILLRDTYAALLQETGRANEIEDMRRFVRPVVMHHLLPMKQS